MGTWRSEGVSSLAYPSSRQISQTDKRLINKWKCVSELCVMITHCNSRGSLYQCRDKVELSAQFYYMKSFCLML